LSANRDLMIIITTRRQTTDAMLARALVNRLGYEEGLVLADFGKPIDKNNRCANIAMIDPGFVHAVENKPMVPIPSLRDIYYCTLMAVFVLSNIHFILTKIQIQGTQTVAIAYLHDFIGDGSEAKLIPPYYPPSDAYDISSNLTTYELENLVKGTLHNAIRFLRWQCIGGNGFELFKLSGYSLHNLLKVKHLHTRVIAQT